MEPGCIRKFNIDNLPAPTDLTENPIINAPISGKKDATQKSAPLVFGYNGELLREKGGVVTQIKA
jgi:hypothetical protein